MTRARTALIAGFTLIALLAGAAGRAAEAPAPRQVTVAGHGETRALPDRATVTLGIEARAAALAAAQAEANRVMGALLAVVRGLGVADSDVHATRLTVGPEYDVGDGRRPRQLVGYAVSRELIVELRDIDRLGLLIEKGLGAGANLVAEPRLDSSRRGDLEREALARAVGDARANAEVVAQALGVRVGAARSVSAAGEPPLVPVPAPRMAIASVAAPTAAETYRPGELTFTASVTASFELEPPPAH
jgi:hypothetical protein